MKLKPATPKISHAKWQNWLIQQFALNVSNRDELIEELRLSQKKNIIANDALEMIEGVLQVENLQVRDVMMPRSQAKILCCNDSYQEILVKVQQFKHSRYPVLDEDYNEVEGILLAKDLLKYIGCEATFNIDDIMRPPFVVPESKCLNTLLTEFRAKRNHMAVIVNEYSTMSGLITIEDVLEQIVGDIDDEHDKIDDTQNIIKQKKSRFKVKAATPIEEFNQRFNTTFSTKKFDTIGGIVTHEMKKIPQQGEEITLAKLSFQVLRSDERHILLLKVIQQK